MLIFPGSRAHSEFRCLALLEKLRAAVPVVERLDTQYIHLLDCAVIDSAAVAVKFAMKVPRAPALNLKRGSGTSLDV